MLHYQSYVAFKQDFYFYSPFPVVNFHYSYALTFEIDFPETQAALARLLTLPSHMVSLTLRSRRSVLLLVYEDFLRLLHCTLVFINETVSGALKLFGRCTFRNYRVMGLENETKWEVYTATEMAMDLNKHSEKRYGYGTIYLARYTVVMACKLVRPVRFTIRGYYFRIRT